MTLIDMQMSFFLFLYFFVYGQRHFRCRRRNSIAISIRMKKKSLIEFARLKTTLSNSSDDKVHHFNIGRMLLGMFRDSKRCFYKTSLKKKNIYKTKWVKVALIVIKIRRGNGTEGHRITASLIGCLQLPTDRSTLTIEISICRSIAAGFLSAR